MTFEDVADLNTVVPILLLISATLFLLGVAVWYRKRSERNRTAVLAIPESLDRVYLFPYDTIGAPRRFRNLSRRTRSGGVLWTAELPSSTPNAFDAYVNAEIQDGKFSAHTWSGIEVDIDLDTGLAVAVRPTK